MATNTTTPAMWRTLAETDPESGLTDGLLLLVPLVTTQYLTALQGRNYPYVLIDQADSSGKSTIVDSTNWQGAYDATRYLIEQGHSRIGFITGLMEIHSAVDRLEGYKAALADHNIPLLDELIVPGDFWHSGGYTAAHQLLDLSTIPTAIFASNDLEAFGAMEAIRERGLEIPKDISIMGFDSIPQSLIVYPKLTTVQQPLEQMGRMAARLLLEQIENPERPPRRITLATQLIVRDSCRPLAQSERR
jgi:LacI family transcriptional regulator